jgi:transposase
MGLKSFESLIRSESSAKWFLVRLCWKNYRRFCRRCHSYQIYRITGKRFRCKRCKYTFHDFSDRWINQLRIVCKQWLWIVKLFELELSARRIAEQTELSIRRH